MARKGIRSAIAADYDHLCSKGGWVAVGERWGVSPAMAWRIVKEDYWPKDVKIQRHLVQRAKELGIMVKRRGRPEDLFSMDDEVLLWKIANREAI